MLRTARAIVAAVILSTLPVQTQEPPARAATKTPKTTAAIRGRVVAADTGRPLRRARVSVSASELTGDRTVETDLEGRYQIGDLPAGRFRVRATKAGYVPLEFGQRRAFEAGTTIDLREGEVVEKIDLALPRGGVIAGRLIDDLGEPLAWARVSAMRSRYVEGKRRYDSVGRSAVTNDLGEYRLYALPPGTYAVGTIPAPTAEDDGYPFAPAYYPGTPDPNRAVRVTIGLGQERYGIDFVQPPGRVVTVSGTVVGARGLAPAGAYVGLVNTRVGSVSRSPVRADGSFSIPNVAPGEYGLAAAMRDPVSGRLETVMVALQVSTSDIDGLAITVVPGSRVTGRVVTPDGASPDFDPAGLRVEVTPIPSQLPTRLPGSLSGASGPPGSIREDWTFEFTGAGASLFTIGKLPQGWMLKSVLLGGQDITDTPLGIDGIREVADLEIVVTNRTTGLTGVVFDDKGDAIHDYTVVVFADEAARWTWPSRFISTARPDRSGSFKLTGLPAATYLAVALDFIDEAESKDPEFLESIRLHGTKVDLAEGETQALRLERVKRADVIR